MDGLGIENIMDGDELSSFLFGNDETSQTEENEGNEEQSNNEETDTAEVDPDSLFNDDEGTPESVGSEEENNKGNKEDTNSQEGGTSPDFFSSIATAFAEEGIFPDLDEDTINNIKDAQSFRDAIVEQINAGLTEQQKRVIECLDNGVEPDQIRQHEQLIDWLDKQSNNIEVEGDAGDDLRRRVIMQDYLNRGFKPERAQQMVDKIFESGTEIDEAKESLQSLKQYYTDSYTKLRKNAKEEAEKEIEERNQKAARIKKSIIEGKTKFFGDIDINKDIRQSAYDAISKPIYRDPKTGETYTAVQKLELDNSEEFLAKLGLLYALTDGFTSIDGLVNKKAKKEIKRGFSELERKINNTARNSYGNLDFTSGVSDENSYIGKGMKLDI
jgi:hypothetical protein